MMKYCAVPNSDLHVSRIGFGLAGLPAWAPGPVTAEDASKVGRLMCSAFDLGITLFDTASLYALGRSETVMGLVFSQSPGMREKIVVQTKCGQIISDSDGWPTPPSISVSEGEIVSSAERSLRRLQTDRIDILQLHLPTPLMEPEEIASAFDHLYRDGKVRYFGVSNFRPSQIDLVQKHLSQPLVANQVQISLYHPHHVVDGMSVSLQILDHLIGLYKRLTAATSPHHAAIPWTEPAEGVLDHCRLRGLQVQAWSPLRHAPPTATKPTMHFDALDNALRDLSRQLSAEPQAVALAWLLKHPAKIVPIMSTTSAEHIRQNAKATELELSDEIWYDLLRESVAAVTR